MSKNILKEKSRKNAIKTLDLTVKSSNVQKFKNTASNKNVIEERIYWRIYNIYDDENIEEYIKHVW